MKKVHNTVTNPTNVTATNPHSDAVTPRTNVKGNKMRNKQGGFSTMDFTFWMIFAALAFVALIGVYTTANAASKKSTTSSDIVQIKSAVEDWRGQRTNLTGVSIDKLCADGYGNKNAPWCGASQDGKLANSYGGDYSVTVSTNVSRVDIAISGIDTEYVTSLANDLAPMSADRCAAIDSCATTTVASDTITVTM